MSIQASLHHPTILVIADVFLARHVHHVLEEAGYAAVVTNDHNEGARLLEEMAPHLILLSLAQEAESLEFARALRKDDRSASTPLVFLGSEADDDIAGALEWGDDYVGSPFGSGELLARVRSRLRGGPAFANLRPTDAATGLLSAQRLNDELQREFYRFRRGGARAALASISLYEIAAIRERYGESGVEHVMRQAADAIRGRHRLLDSLARTGTDEIAMLMPETTAEQALVPLERMSGQIVVGSIGSQEGELRFTPVIGVADFADGPDAATVQERARNARRFAEAQLDLRPVRWDSTVEREAKAHSGPSSLVTKTLRHFGRFSTTAEVLMTFLVGLVLPFLAYVALYEAGVDVSWPLYLIVVASLVLTGGLIWTEGLLALRRPIPPAEPGEPYPPATAIIAAYLPNEAGTIVETLDAFLSLEYPAELQIILAYNTPEALPVELELRRLAAQNPSLHLLQVRESTSKAQNINAALREARGRFVGVFDADHQPQKESFARAWRWLSNGYAVVQGHCMIRNGDSSALARLVSVEFEAMYAVSHPGRARLHHFAIFGGSNGYWRTDVLHKIRMRSSMLTEDIDSSLRLLMAGDRIVCDPGLISTELAPVRLSHLWHQRTRWAQGWFQVSMKHLWRGLFSSRFSGWQRLGLAQLLFWREIYPWVSLQVLPLVAFWVWQRGSLGALDWLIPIFVLTTLFTLTVGPGQSILAYWMGDPSIKRHRMWFVAYFFFASIFYAEFKNTISRVAQLRQLLGQHEWVVTPRRARDRTESEPALSESIAEDAGRSDDARPASAVEPGERRLARFLKVPARAVKRRPLDSLIIAADLMGLRDRDIPEIARQHGITAPTIEAVGERRIALRQAYGRFRGEPLAGTAWLAVFIESLSLEGGSTELACVWGYTSTGERRLITLLDPGRPLNWGVVLRRLRNQGLADPGLVVSLEAPPTTAAVRDTWPEAEHQASAVNLLAEICDHLPRQSYLRRDFRAAFWTTLDEASDPVEASQQLRLLANRLRGRYPRAAADLSAHLAGLVPHTSYPVHVRRRLRSANFLERRLRPVLRQAERTGSAWDAKVLAFLSWLWLDLAFSEAPRLSLEDRQRRPGPDMRLSA